MALHYTSNATTYDDGQIFKHIYPTRQGQSLSDAQQLIQLKRFHESRICYDNRTAPIRLPL